MKVWEEFGTGVARVSCPERMRWIPNAGLSRRPLTKILACKEASYNAVPGERVEEVARGIIVIKKSNEIDIADQPISSHERTGPLGTRGDRISGADGGFGPVARAA